MKISKERENERIQLMEKVEYSLDRIKQYFYYYNRTVRENYYRGNDSYKDEQIIEFDRKKQALADKLADKRKALNNNAINLKAELKELESKEIEFPELKERRFLGLYISEIIWIFILLVPVPFLLLVLDFYLTPSNSIFRVGTLSEHIIKASKSIIEDKDDTFKYIFSIILLVTVLNRIRRVRKYNYLEEKYILDCKNKIKNDELEIEGLEKEKLELGEQSSSYIREVKLPKEREVLSDFLYNEFIKLADLLPYFFIELKDWDLMHNNFVNWVRQIQHDLDAVLRAFKVNQIYTYKEMIDFHIDYRHRLNVENNNQALRNELAMSKQELLNEVAIARREVESAKDEAREAQRRANRAENEAFYAARQARFAHNEAIKASYRN